MKIFPAVHYSMGGLWVDYERIGRRRPAARLAAESADEHPGPVRHRRMRLSVSRREPARGEFAAELHLQRPDRRAGHRDAAQIAQGRRGRRLPAALVRAGAQASIKQQSTMRCSTAPGGERESVSHSPGTRRGDDQGRHRRALQRRRWTRPSAKSANSKTGPKQCSLSDTGNWTNQNVVFTKALRDMFPLAKTILKGALQRDECRGAHFKPDFAMPGLEATDPAERRRRGRAVVRPVRSEHPQVAENDDRHVRRRRRAAADLRRRRHHRSFRPGPGCMAWSAPK